MTPHARFPMPGIIPQKLTFLYLTIMNPALCLSRCMLRASVRWWMVAPAILIPLVATSSWICYRALAARDQAAVEAQAANHIPATFGIIDPHAASHSEAVVSAAEFRDAAVFNGRVYISGPQGLYGYDSSGSLSETYLAGRDLPPGELTALGRSATELFLATAGAGVLAFDGSRFRQILPTDRRLRNFTTVLGLDSGGVLLGTPDRGVMLWNGKTLAEFLPSLGHLHITALTGSDADLWIGTLDAGAWHMHAGQLDHILADLPDPHVLSIAVNTGSSRPSDGAAAYVGTPVGVVEFRDGRKARVLAEGYFARSLDAGDDSLAVGTEDEGILSVPLHEAPRPGEASLSGGAPAEFDKPVERILRIDGVRYALAGGLYKAAVGRSGWTRVLEPEKGALSDRNIAALAVAHDGRVWVGYFDRGLDVADGGFENIRHFEDEHLFCVNRIVDEPGGARTAVATANGLVMFDPGLAVRQVMDRKDGLLADHVTDVLFRQRGMVVATPAGLSLADADGVHSLYVLQGLVNNHVYALASAGDRIAAGTLGGLSLLENDAVQVNYTTANSALRHNWISALARVGNDWFVGTYGAGVMQLDASGRWTSFPDLKSGFEVNPNAMAQTADAVYVGSLGEGMWVYSKPTERWTNVTAGLPSLNVTAVAVGNGYVYAGTDNGLVRFREGELK
jgi:ligand-binding sensor domain-containing protein